MYSDHDELILRQIRNKLGTLVLDEASLEHVSRAIKARIAFLSWKPPPDSDFFDFDGKVDKVVQAFAADGLTRHDYLKAVMGEPGLLCLKPGRIIENVDGVADHFAADGLTRRDYLRAAVKQPALLGQKPATIIENVEGVADHFAADGLTRRDYLRAAVKQPPLFAQKSGTIIGHINLAVDLYRRGLLSFPDSPPSRGIDPVLKMMMKQPVLLCLSDDNFALREIHARVTDTRMTATSLRKFTRAEVERELAAALGSDDRNVAIPKIGQEQEAAKGEHARNLLLRALVRQGMIQGRLQ